MVRVRLWILPLTGHFTVDPSICYDLGSYLGVSAHGTEQHSKYFLNELVNELSKRTAKDNIVTSEAVETAEST